jgi:hypothetical protein
VWQKRRQPVKPIRRKRESPIRVQQTQSAFHPHAQLTANSCIAPLQFHKRSQHFIGSHDELLSIAMRVNNPDRPPL